ncbi:MAG: DUF89 family protein [Bacteroidales bacterium]|nr:DUF89 family protein [Bacteroidales bacterium]
MNIQSECIPCTINSYLRLVKTGVIPESQQEALLRRLLKDLATIDYDQSPPMLGRRMHRMIRDFLQNPDPYQQIKEKYNHMMLGLYPKFEGLVNDSEDPFNAAMRLAIAGNVIDFGAQKQMDVMDMINKAMGVKLAIDDSLHLRHDLKHADTLLYIGDNCGEIVMDKLFLTYMNVPEKYFAVRDRPVINDVTLEDANMTGMEEVAKVITTGDDAPGAVWDSVSEEFRNIFRTADIVISKGQGNLEGLIDVPHKSIYFLLITKCDLIASRVGAKTEEYVIKKGTIIK